MENLDLLIARIRTGDRDAFATLVKSYQDMAVAYAYAILGDFHLAQDASQEAFVNAWKNLHQLHDPNAFPQWFRTIVFKYCNRIFRQRGIELVGSEIITEIPSHQKDPLIAIEEQEMEDIVRQAIETLPEQEQAPTLLFYMGGYSHKEIAQFLAIPLSTVNNRLRAARSRLKERLVENMVKETLSKRRPSRDDEFAKKVLFKAIKQADTAKISQLLDRKPMLIDARDEQQRTPIESLVKGQHPSTVEKVEIERKAIYNLLIQKGAEPDLHVAIALNDIDAVEEIISEEPTQIEQRFEPSASYGTRLLGMRPLALAATFGRMEIMQRLIQAGVEVQADGNLALVFAVTTSE